jgi:hypothetical protein
MQERVYYEDQVLRVTASEIRGKQLTIKTSSVTSVSIASVRPGKWLPLIVLLPILPLYLIIAPLGRILGVGSMRFLVPVFFPLVIFVPLSLLRVSRIFLQTSGGPVLLAAKMELGDASTTLARYNVIKDSIEKAMRAA